MIGRYPKEGTPKGNLVQGLFWLQKEITEGHPDSIQFVEKNGEVYVQALDDRRVVGEYLASSNLKIENGRIHLFSWSKPQGTKGGYDKGNNPGAMSPIPVRPMAAHTTQNTYLALTTKGDICLIKKTGSLGVVTVVPVAMHESEYSLFRKTEILETVVANNSNCLR
ncbi:MAG: hypothetical protein AAF065_02335 [Verrucomicrobiota bacterium]